MLDLSLEVGIERLIHAHQNVGKLVELPESCGPHSLADGYAMHGLGGSENRRY